MYQIERANSSYLSSRRSLSNGFATMEYCIICGLLAMVLFANPNSAIELVDAIKAFYRTLTFYISLP